MSRYINDTKRCTDNGDGCRRFTLKWQMSFEGTAASVTILNVLALKLHHFKLNVILQTVSNLFLCEHCSFLFKPCSVFSSTTRCTRWCSWRKVEIRPEWGKGQRSLTRSDGNRRRTVFNFPWLSRYVLQRVTRLTLTSITLLVFH